MIKGNKENRDPLRTVPHNQGFHFYTAIGESCGVTCTSLEEFANAIQYVCSDAIRFHFERADFQNWIREVIGDPELAQRIENIGTCSRELSAECCRKELFEEVRIRILQLEVQKARERPPC
jgi:hypothetical protein